MDTRCPSCQASVSSQDQRCPQCGLRLFSLSRRASGPAQAASDLRSEVACSSTNVQTRTPSTATRKSQGWKGITSSRRGRRVLLVLSSLATVGVVVLIWSLLGLNEPRLTPALADSYYSAGRYNAAVASYEQLLEDSPTDLRMQTRLGWSYYHQGRLQDATLAFQRVLSASPESSDALMGLGVCYYNMNQMESAIAAFNTLVELEPNRAGPHSYLGVIYAQQENEAQALTHFRKAAEIAPNDWTALIGAGKIELRQGQPAAAVTYFLSALATRPDDPELKRSLGLAYFDAGQLIEAQFYLREAEQAFPDDVLVQATLAQALLRQGKPHQAREYLLNTLEREGVRSDLALFFRTLGEASFVAGDAHEALDSLMIANKLAAGDPQTLSLMGQCYLALEDCQRAVPAIREALAAGAGGQEVLKGLELCNAAP